MREHLGCECLAGAARAGEQRSDAARAAEAGTEAPVVVDDGTPLGLRDELAQARRQRLGQDEVSPRPVRLDDLREPACAPPRGCPARAPQRVCERRGVIRLRNGDPDCVGQRLGVEWELRCCTCNGRLVERFGRGCCERRCEQLTAFAIARRRHIDARADMCRLATGDEHWAVEWRPLVGQRLVDHVREPRECRLAFEQRGRARGGERAQARRVQAVRGEPELRGGRRRDGVQRCRRRACDGERRRAAGAGDGCEQTRGAGCERDVARRQPIRSERCQRSGERRVRASAPDEADNAVGDANASRRPRSFLVDAHQIEAQEAAGAPEGGGVHGQRATGRHDQVEREPHRQVCAAAVVLEVRAEPRKLRVDLGAER